MNDKSVRVVIEGRVQGVWYRGWALEQAQRLNLQGWVRNRRDGTVEALFSGAPETVDEMINACRKGPPMAKVTALGQHSAEPPEDKGFRALPTT